MDKLKQLNKKKYISPQIEIFQSLKEITLANTCGCDYFDNGHMASCNACYDGPLGTGQIACPGPEDIDPSFDCW